MKTSIPKIALIIMISISGALQGFGQQKGSLFLGLTPDLTVEPDYDKGEFDVNIIPLVAQYYLSPTLALKVATIVNLHVNEGSEISHLGGQFSVPVYFLSQKESFASGFYLAPVFGISHNMISEGNELTAALEPGYTWITESGFTMNLGVQLGGTYFTANDETAGWRNHFGLKFSLGYTF